MDGAQSPLLALTPVLTAIFEENPLPMWVLDRETLRFLDVNRAAVRRYGYSREEFLSLTVRDICLPEEPAAPGAGPNPGGPVRRGEIRHRTKGGAVLTVEVTAQEVRFGGRPAYLAMVLDTTEQRRAEDERARLLERERAARAEAEQARALLDAFFQAAPVAAAFLDRDLRYRRINRALAAIDGVEPEEVVGKTLREVIPDFAPRLEPIYRRVLETGEAVQNLEVSGPHPSAPGSTGHFLVNYFPVRPEGGEVTGVGLVALDITERRRAEEEIVRQEAQFRTMVDFIPQLAWMADAGGSIFWYNRRWYDFTGTTLEEMAGWGWRGVHHPDHVDRVVERIRHAFETGAPWEDTFPLRGRDGEYRWFLSRALPIRDARGRVVRWFGTNTDVTEQRETEQARDRALREARVARDAAEDANRAKAQFLAAMSHELRTPLNAIGGYVDLMELGIQGPVTEAQNRSMERIRANQQHLLTLINDILHYARIEAGKLEFEMEDVSPADVISHLEPLIEPQVRAADLEYACESCDPGLTAWGDREKIRQILLNLLANAVKFTPAGGRVRMRCTADDPWMLIEVGDTGRGIPGEMVPRIFDPFVQVREAQSRDPSRKGVGLGLAISRDLARGMGGDLTVESTPGRGSTFTLSLPMRPWDEGDSCRRTGEDRRAGADRRADEPEPGEALPG